MIKHQSNKFLILFSFVVLILVNASVFPQTMAELRRNSSQLISQDKYIEALPYLEKIIQSDPNDARTQYQLGFAYINKAVTLTNPKERKEIRFKARQAFLRARELGMESLLLEGMIDSIAPDGEERGKFSFNAEAEELMRQAEAHFAKREMDDALDKYQKALEVDPKLYYAALFSGDVFLQKGDYGQAEIWYKKAVAINPFIETAYRYSATPLMKQKKFAEALPRYIESYITAPYNKMAISGLTQWGQATGKKLGHPRFDIPKTETGADGAPKATINLNPLTDDDSVAWISYVATRETWKKAKFAEMFPNEREYRHTLQEEADALRSVLKTAKEMKVKNKNPQLEILRKLDDSGLLEAYILLALADGGIAQDHFKYLKLNRDKLRQYVAEYVIEK